MIFMEVLHYNFYERAIFLVDNKTNDENVLNSPSSKIINIKNHLASNCKFLPKFIYEK